MLRSAPGLTVTWRPLMLTLLVSVTLIFSNSLLSLLLKRVMNLLFWAVTSALKVRTKSSVTTRSPVDLAVTVSALVSMVSAWVLVSTRLPAASCSWAVMVLLPVPRLLAKSARQLPSAPTVV